MNTKQTGKLTPGITLRTALASWLVTIATLLIFVAVIIPQQKQVFEENLESKAHGVAVSLRDVAAGAAVNEDFSSVVDHCKEMLKGDPGLDYLVITKNDGFSLINHRKGWYSESDAGKEWRPDRREPSSGIGVVPLFGYRVFHYSQPFDYSGIQWGWIHVGLSLESYDRSVAAVYHRTGLVAVVCILISLLASAVYAKHLVRPILSLRTTVQRVAGGDLSARAEVTRGDELGSLAGSVNTMTEALLRRDRILQSVRFAAQQFLSTPDWTAVIQAVLAEIGQAANVSRAYVFENHHDEHGVLLTSQRYEWVADGIQSSLENEILQGVDYHATGFGRWFEVLSSGKILSDLVAKLPASERPTLEAQAIRSLMVIPIHVEGVWWGFLGIDDCLYDRTWTDSDRDSLRAAADMLGATIARQKGRQALVEAKQTLELRVHERTRELQELVVAKEEAHADLAQAQQRLLGISRQAGMAEVATHVLHNVGNILNSVNVSVDLINEQLGRSQVPNLARLSTLLDSHRADLAVFLTSDPKGQRVPEFVSQLGDRSDGGAR